MLKNFEPNNIFVITSKAPKYVLGLFFIIVLTALYLKKFSFFKKNKNLYLLGSFAYFIYTFIPLVPSGSFFTSFNATLFWINYCFLYSQINFPTAKND